MMIDHALKRTADLHPDDMLDLVILLRSGNVKSLRAKLGTSYNPFHNVQLIDDDLMFSCQMKGQDLALLDKCDQWVESVEDNSLQDMI